MLCIVAFCSGFLCSIDYPNLIILYWGEEEDSIDLSLIAIDVEINKYVMIRFVMIVFEAHACFSSSKKLI
jgi:hypothetical protein